VGPAHFDDGGQIFVEHVLIVEVDAEHVFLFGQIAPHLKVGIAAEQGVERADGLGAVGAVDVDEGQAVGELFDETHLVQGEAEAPGANRAHAHVGVFDEFLVVVKEEAVSRTPVGPDHGHALGAVEGAAVLAGGPPAVDLGRQHVPTGVFRAEVDEPALSFAFFAVGHGAGAVDYVGVEADGIERRHLEGAAGPPEGVLAVFPQGG